MIADSGLFRRRYRSQSKLSADDLKLESISGRFQLFRLVGEKTIQIINDSNVIIYVTVHDNTSPLRAVGPKRRTALFIAKDTMRMTISYYDKSGEMKDMCSACLFNDGSVIRVFMPLAPVS